MFDWQEIKTVLLDMDGTILDLHFDNHFWLEHLPKRYSEAANISIEAATAQLTSYYHEVAGTIKWYCLDYWAAKTNLPITELKREVQHLITLREDAIAFMLALKAANKELVLVTNAHPGSLSLKIERTQLDQYFNALYSTHQFGVSKEDQSLWQQLQHQHGFDLQSTLFIDDSLPILASAATYGFKHLLAVANPDSKKANNQVDNFKSITDFRTLIPAIK